MPRVVTGTNGYGTRQMETTDLTVQILSLPETEKGPISQKAPTYRKYVKRRENLETIKCLQETSIQVV